MAGTDIGKIIILSSLGEKDYENIFRRSLNRRNAAYK